jgi:FtsZ-interacting cell division protein ZipA
LDLIKVIITLIVVVVFLVANLFKNREEQRRTLRRNQPRGEDEGGPTPRPRRSASEVDKFLEEVRRRREAAEAQRRPRPTPPPAPPRPRPSQVESTFPRPVPLPLPVPPPLPAPPVRIPSTENRPVPTQRVAAREEIIMAQAVPELAAMRSPPAPPPAARVKEEPVSAIAAQAVNLLANPRSVAATIVLQEILKQPLCMRPMNVPAYRK